MADEEKRIKGLIGEQIFAESLCGTCGSVTILKPRIGSITQGGKSGHG